MLVHRMKMEDTLLPRRQVLVVTVDLQLISMFVKVGYRLCCTIGVCRPAYDEKKKHILIQVQN